MQTLTLNAPAKVNLYLNILNKRPDGFHDIETIFEKISLCDEITLKRRPQGIRIICADKDVPDDERNLCFQAAQAFLTDTGRRGGVAIKIVKRIPVACGLGGGSSDAASTILGLNRLFRTRLKRRQLHKIAAALGADVPFFLLKGSRAIGQGKGDVLTPLDGRKKYWYILVAPPFKLSTRRMYQDPRIALTKGPANVKIITCALTEGDLTTLGRYSYNSFESALRKKQQKIQEIKKALRSAGVTTTFMSGSGPCVFGVTKTGKEAMAISARLRNRNKTWQVIAARTYVDKQLQQEE